MKRYIPWVVALLGVTLVYTSGLDYGRPAPEYAPSTVQDAWLNPETVFHPDAFAYVGTPYRMLLNFVREPRIGNLNTAYYHNPTLNIYTNLLLFALSGTASLPHNFDIPDIRAVAPFSLYVMAQYMSALYMLLAAALLYAAGRAAFNWRVGSLAAGLAALAPLSAQHAHYATPNAQTTLVAAAALLAGFMILKGRWPRWISMPLMYFAGGFLVGLAGAARYNAAIVGVVTAPAMFTAWRAHRRWRPVTLGLAAIPLGFVIGVPGAVFDTPEFIRQALEILDWYRVRGGGPGWTSDYGLSAFFYHWRYMLLFVIGPLAGGAALLGLGVMLSRRRAGRWRDTWIGGALALYMALYTIIALPGRRLQANLLLALLAPCALLTAYGVVWLWERFGRRRWVMAGLALLVLAWPAYLSLRFASLIAAPDNRMLAQAWVYQHVPKGSRVYLLGPYNVPLDPLDYETRQTYGGEATAEDVRHADAQIIVYSEAYPFAALRDPALYAHNLEEIANEQAIIKALASEWVELARFERQSWPGQHTPPDDVSYWHQFGIVIYCNPTDCPVEQETP